MKTVTRPPERRQRERYSLRIPVKMVSLSPSNVPDMLSCMTKDISEKGAHLALQPPLNLGTKVEMLFDISGQPRTPFSEPHVDTTIHAKGQVVRHTERGFAVFFDECFRVAATTQHYKQNK